MTKLPSNQYVSPVQPDFGNSSAGLIYLSIDKWPCIFGDTRGIIVLVPISILDIAVHLVVIVNRLDLDGLPTAFNGDARLVNLMSDV